MVVLLTILVLGLVIYASFKISPVDCAEDFILNLLLTIVSIGVLSAAVFGLYMLFSWLLR